jgi:hypothetical protein
MSDACLFDQAPEEALHARVIEVRGGLCGVTNDFAKLAGRVFLYPGAGPLVSTSCRAHEQTTDIYICIRLLLDFLAFCICPARRVESAMAACAQRDVFGPDAALWLCSLFVVSSSSSLIFFP